MLVICKSHTRSVWHVYAAEKQQVSDVVSSPLQQEMRGQTPDRDSARLHEQHTKQRQSKNTVNTWLIIVIITQTSVGTDCRSS